MILAGCYSVHRSVLGTYSKVLRSHIVIVHADRRIGGMRSGNVLFHPASPFFLASARCALRHVVKSHIKR